MSEPRAQPEARDAPEAAPKPARPGVRIALYTIAFALLAFCIYTAMRHGAEGWRQLAVADPRDIALMAACVAASIALNGWVFWVIVKPFERPGQPVSLGDMTALIAATGLLNYFPGRAGLIGRAAYLRQRHGVGYRVSAAMMIMVAGGTVLTYALLVAMTLGRSGFDAWWWGGMVVGLVIAALVNKPAVIAGLTWFPGVTATWFRKPEATVAMWAFWLLAARAVDVSGVAVRLYLAAKIFGEPITFEAAMIMAAGGTIVTLLTPLPNALGLREGLYGLFATLGVGAADLSGGVRLGLLDRAVEAAVFLATGLAGLALVHRKTTR